jgi:hypothetical protein
MNCVLIGACWRERFSRPLVLVLLLVVSLVSLVESVSDRSMSQLCSLFALILGAGLVGRDVSSGALALLFTRPVKRSHYLLSRWMAGGIAAATLSVVLQLAQFLTLRVRGVEISGTELLNACGEAITASFGLTACLIFLSTLMRGIGDLGLWFLAGMLSVLCELAGARRVSDEMDRLLAPKLDWAQALMSRPISWFEIVSYASSVTLFLALGLVMINGKEISYASHT